MRSVASRDEIASELLRFAVLAKQDGRFRGRFRLAEIANTNILHVEKNPPAGRQPCLHQILNHFMLGVNHDAASAGEFSEIDVMRAPGEPQVYSAVNQPFSAHPFT